MTTYVGLAAIREEAAWRNVNKELVKIKEAEGQTFEKVEVSTLSSDAKVLSREVLFAKIYTKRLVNT